MLNGATIWFDYCWFTLHFIILNINVNHSYFNVISRFYFSLNFLSFRYSPLLFLPLSFQFLSILLHSCPPLLIFVGIWKVGIHSFFWLIFILALDQSLFCLYQTLKSNLTFRFLFLQILDVLFHAFLIWGIFAFALTFNKDFVVLSRISGILASRRFGPLLPFEVICSLGKFLR